MDPNVYGKTSLRPLNRNEAACLQKDFKPIRLVYSEQPLTARILVDGSKVRSVASRSVIELAT